MWLRLIVEIFLVLSAQAGLSELIEIGGYRPDFVIIYLVFRYQSVSSYQLVLGGFLLGFLQDLLSGGFLGVSALAKTIAAFLLTKLFRKEGPLHNVSFAAGAALCFIIHDFIYQYIFWQTEYMGFLPFFFKRVLPVTFYNLVIMVLILLIPLKKKRFSPNKGLF
jgi:rod shape-determining protein MreD